MSKPINVEIEINNWYQTYAKIDYQNRFYFLDRRAGELGIEEWLTKEDRQARSVLTFLNTPVREWVRPYRQEEMTTEEIMNVFFQEVGEDESL